MSDITDESVAALVRGFEDGSWPGANWKHTQHVMLAAVYVLDYPDALERLQTGIPKYNLSQGGQNTPDSGYHETLTRFWYEVIRAWAADLPASLTRIEKIRHVVEEFAPRRDLFRSYYDFDVLKSREARAAWIPPSVPLPDKHPTAPKPAKSTAPA